MMPFPWKRVKSTKISQLVNDHLHKSQKRRDGSSLVVETGFPTSLVDLFIKNRGKLKSSKKKRHSPPLTPLSDANDPAIAESSVPYSSAPTSPYAMISLPIAGSPDPVDGHLECLPASPNSAPLPLPLISRDSDERLVVGTSGGNASAGVVDVKKDFFVFLKIFLVVILSLGMKRLTVGITISAFLLLFLEYVGKHACGLLKPSADSKGLLRWMVQRVVLLLGFKKVMLDEKSGGLLWMPELQQDPVLRHESNSQKSFESRCLNQEIQIAKNDLLTCMDEIQPEGDITAESCSEAMFICQEIESKELVVETEGPKREVEELKKIKSRRAKIHSKMKKFFHKKLRCSRKEVASCSKQIIDECPDEVTLENVSELLSVSSARNTDKEEDERSAPLALGELPEVNEETATRNQDKGKEIQTGLTWSNLVLCLIVLVGLIGGRAFALLLTLSWYLLLKLGEKLSRVGSFDEKSG